MPLFLIFIIFNSHTGHAVHHTFIHHSPFAEASLLVSSSLLRLQQEEPPWDADRAENRTWATKQRTTNEATPHSKLRHTLAI
jgi:hypothetical protein